MQVTTRHLNSQALEVYDKQHQLKRKQGLHTCTGFLLNTWNASALIDKNLRNFLVSMFSSSSDCLTYQERNDGSISVNEMGEGL